MDLLEELELEQHEAASASAVGRGDFVQQHIRHLQTQLQMMWTAKKRTESVVVSYMWLFAQLLRLVEQYPDGLTDGILLTELMTKLQQREYANRKSGVAINDDQPVMQALDGSDENAVIEATLLQAETHRLTMSVKAIQSSIQMFLHQRFRACIQLLQSMQNAPIYASSSFPFQKGREIAFTNVKLMERRENGSRQEDESPMQCLLPTTYMALQLQDPADQCFLMYSISLPQLHELAGRGDSPQLQQCIINAKVLDIGAVRPNKTIFHVQRQVILLGELNPPTHGGQHAMMILWDDQVALSRLFHVGERLTLVYPYIHLCGVDDVELGHIANENASERSFFYMEYGSATVMFRSSVQATGGAQSLSQFKTKSNATSLRPQTISSRSMDPTRIEDIAADSSQFAVHGHVASIRVAHGLPLLAAFFHAYYNQKTEHSTKTMLATSQDRTLVASYHFVVLLKLYNAESKQFLAVEVTGASAQAALRLEIGQSVLLEGLIAVDLHGDESIRSKRDSKSAPAETHWAFENVQYTQVETTTSTSAMVCSKVVALCSDWTHLFGIQSIFADNARVMLLNATPGLLTTTWARDQALLGSQTLSPSMAMTVTQVTLHLSGWLVPSDPVTRQRTNSPMQCDDKCDKAGATITVHRFCSREIDGVPSTTQRNAPKWQCLFCNEMFSGMEETMQAFSTMLVSLDFGLESDQTDQQAIIHGDLLETLFDGVTADDYAQLNIQAKRDLLVQASGREYTALLSRCPPRRFGSYDHPGVELRIDMLQPVDAFAGSQTLLARLRGPSGPR